MSDEIQLPPLPPFHIVPSVEPVDYPEVAQVLMDYARAAVLADREQRAQPAPAEGQPIKPGLALDAAKHLTNWMRMALCECEVGQYCDGYSEVKRTRDALLEAAEQQPSPADEAVRLLADIKAWDVSQYLSLPLHLRKRIQAALASQQQEGK